MQCTMDAAYYTQVLSALALVVVRSRGRERAVSVPFEWGWLTDYLDRFKLRAPISFGVAYAICAHAKFDVLQMIMPNCLSTSGTGNSTIGLLLTAGVIAGGSKGAILLFQGMLGFGQQAVDATIARKTLAAVTPTSAPAPAGGVTPPSGARAGFTAGAIAASPTLATAGMAGVDTNSNCTNFAQGIAGEGYKFVCRYYRPGDIGALTHGEAQALIGAGLSLVAVFEGGGNKPSWFSAAQGTADAQHALDHAAKVGQPSGTAIYFAVDYDASAGDVGAGISAYFGAIKAAFAAAGAPFRIGVYGSGLVCQTIIAAGLASTGWLSGSTGWRSYSSYLPHANLVQAAPEVTICNGQLSVDRNVGQTADFGAFSTLVSIAPAGGAPWWRN